MDNLNHNCDQSSFVYHPMNIDFGKGLVEHTHCQNTWCGRPLSVFDRRAYKNFCRLCEVEKEKYDEARRIARGLGDDDDRKYNLGG